MKTKNLNPADFAEKHPACKIGNVYPNLSSQASYIKQDVEKTKEQIIKTVSHLHDFAGLENAKLIIDSIYDYIEREFAMAKDCDKCEDHFSETTIREMSSNVYSLGEIAKGLIDLSNLSERLSELDKRAELTKKNILL